MLLPTFNTKSFAVGAYLLSHAIPASAWDWVAHDAVTSLPNTTPGGAISKFQPTLSVKDGCVPFPAIDLVNWGRVGSGLNPSGGLSAGCGSSTGQIYARAGYVEGIYAIYYAWYFPKDQILNGPLGLGHRHDWEGLVVFTTDASASASIRAICPARHGTEQSKYFCDLSNFQLDGNRPKIQYRPDGTHAIFTTSTGGGSHPLVTWEGIGALGRQMLVEAGYGSANVPFLDGVFESNILNAKRASGLV